MLRVYEDRLWCEECWNERDVIWMEDGDCLEWDDLEIFISPEKELIAKLEEQLILNKVRIEELESDLKNWKNWKSGPSSGGD